MTDITILFREKKIKATPQRLRIFKELSSSFVHLSAVEIFEKTQKDLPALSLGTVYAILGAFQKKGLIREVKVQPGKTYYEAWRGMHHHFFCRGCQTIYDVEIPFCAPLKNKEADGHLIEDFQGNFYGLCRVCQTKKPSRKNK